jgi:DNA-binding transcriptional ArsR family regulator
MTTMPKKDKNDAALKAVGHPLRRMIMRRLEKNANGGLSPSELAKEMDAPLTHLSYHVRILAQTGVIKLVKTTPRRGAVEHHYKRAGNAVDKKAAQVLDLINGKK